MAKIENFSDVRDKQLVRGLIKEKIDKQWLRELILGKKGIGESTGQGCNSLADNFMIYVWDNLTSEQQNKVVESLNLIIEEDLLTNTLHINNYSFHLLDFAILLNRKLPGKINSKPFILWKEKNYPNFSQPIDHNHPVIRDLDQKIESAFGKK